MTRNLAQDFLNAPLIQVLGEILLHSLWQGVALALVLLTLLWWVKPTATRYALAYSGLVLCLVLPITTYVILAARPVQTTGMPTHSNVLAHNQNASWTQAPSTGRAFDDVTESLALKGERAVQVQPAQVSWALHELVRSMLRWLALGWFFGLGILVTRLALGLQTTHKLRTCFVSPVSCELEATVKRLTAQLSIKQQVSIAVSKIADVPLVIGFIKPVVLIPAALLSGLTPRQLEMLVAHELAHVRRFDHVANLTQNIIETLLFFNPAALWISALVRQEREYCCDALAVKISGGDKVEYARALSTLNQIRAVYRYNLAADGGSLVKRIHRLTGTASAERLLPGHGVAALVLVILPMLLTSVVSAQAQGGTLRIAYSTIQQLDPYKSANSDEINAYAQIFDPLITFSQDDYQPVPHLAESWETPDDTTWVFKLREGVTFQDGNDVFPEGEGRELTADDVVYSINRFLEVSTAFTLGDIEEVAAVDRYTVRIKTAAPDPFLVTDPNRLGRVLIVPREAIEQLGEEEFARNPVGSGPFEITSFTPDQSLEFTRNEDYWLPINLGGLEFVFIPDPTVQTIALESGDVDVIPYIFNVDSVSQLSENPDLTLIEGFGSYRGLGFNVTTPPFDELAVRDAISKAIDIDGAIAAVVAPFGVRAYGQVAPWTGFETDASLGNLWEYNPDAALAELAEAGFADSDGDGILDRDGQPLSFNIKTIAGSHVRVLTILVTQMQELGIDANLLQQDGAVWGDDLQQGNDTGVFFDYSFSGITGLYSLFHSSNNGRSNTHFYSNAEVDALLDEASRTLDFQTRNDLWLEAQKLIMQDRVGIPLYFESGYAVTSNRVQDFVPAIAGLHLVSTENNVSLSD